MAGNIKGITVEIGGNTTKLGSALAEVNQKTSSLQAELREVEKALKFNPGNTELLAQKQELLGKIVEETSGKLGTLKSVYDQVDAKFKAGEVPEEDFRKFKREVVETESKLNTFKGKLDETDDGLDKAGESAEDSGDGFTVMKGALADVVGNVITGAVSKIGELVGQLFELSEATEEYRTMQAKLSGSAKNSGYSTEFAKSKYEEFYKYLGDDQASTNAITNLMGLGTSTESITKLAEGATASWTAYGDSINPESLTESIAETVVCGKVTGSLADTINWCKTSNEGLNSALSGNKEAQKAYNDAIKEGLPVEDAFNEALGKITNEQERADVVAKFLNETYGESKKTYDELNGSVLDAREAELKLKETQAELGATMEPINTAFTNLKNQALQAITPLVQTLAQKFLDLYTYLQEHPTLLKIITAVVIALATAFGVLATALAIQGIISGVTKAIAFLNTTLLANPIVLIVALIAGLVAGFIYLWNNCDAFREFWINLWDKIQSVIGTAIEWVKNFVTVTIPQVIDNIVNWFKQLPGKIWTWLTNTINKVTTWASNMSQKAKDTGSKFITSIVNFFKQLPGKVWTWLVNVVTKVTTWASNMATKAKTAGTNFINGVVNKLKQAPAKAFNALKGCYAKVTSWGSSMVTKAKTAMGNVVTGIGDKLKTAVTKVKTIGKDIVTGLWNGISDKVEWIKSKLVGFKDAVIKKLKDVFDINSPSRLMKTEIGYNLSAGVAEGIDSGEPGKAVDKMADDILNGVSRINGATLDRRLNSTFTGTVDNSLNGETLLSKLDNIYERLNRLQIVLDTGTLVGETIDKIDAGLGSNYALRARGV